ncbi:MAG: hypothetical protein JG766_1958 [Desulfacinum sp.]|nr:hypothetical protein [Desulfacinum sp.]
MPIDHIGRLVGWIDHPIDRRLLACGIQRLTVKPYEPIGSSSKGGKP